MNDKVFKTLEMDKIIDMLDSCASSSLGKELVHQLRPSINIEEVTTWQRETGEAVTMIMKKGSLSLGGLKNITPYLQRVNVGGVLSVEELVNVGDFLYCNRKAKSYGVNDSKNDSYPILEAEFDGIILANELEKEIERCISAGEIQDNASNGLRDVRRNIRQANDKIREQLNGIIHSQTYKNMLQDAVITIRNERYCVPVKQEYKNSFSGMIHDQSATGATVFIEPMSVVQLNNKIKDLHTQEKNEINKILAKLSNLVYENKDILSANLDIMAHLDFVFAKAELSVKINGTEPILNTKGYINIKKARHPLLNKDSVVATDIYLGRDFNTLLITGPNTGGKTVSLKTIGLFTLMAQCGLHISAFDNSEISIFEEVFADIGDEQSIEQSLSTFSSHMTNIVKILDNVTNNSLVLLDELGAGTDPTEGAALAIAVIKYLHDLGVRTAVTTHYSELKLFALTTEGVENASCEFDVETLRPTYKLLIGVPGKSNAFAISKRLGLPDYIINQAKEVLSHEDVKFEDVITDLEISKKSLMVEQERAEQYRQEAQRLKNDVQNQKNKLREQRENIIKQANEEARRLISDAKDEADAIIKEMRKMQREGIEGRNLEEKRQKLKEKMEGMDKKLNSMDKKKKHKVPKKLVIGDNVFIHSLGQSGIVSVLPDNNGNVLVKTGIMRVKIHISDLSLEQEKEEIKKPVNKYSGSFSNKKSHTVSPEIDLRGLMSDEAIEKTDKYLDDAYLAHLSPVTIIHGKGTGVLRKVISEHLKKHPHVKSYRLGQYGEGESGVTVVELK